MGGAGDGGVKVYSKLEETARPYVDGALVSGKKLWAEGGEKVLAVGSVFLIPSWLVYDQDHACFQVREGARWLEREHGDTLKSTWDTLKTSFLTLWAMVQISCLISGLKIKLNL